MTIHKEKLSERSVVPVTIADFRELMRKGQAPNVWLDYECTVRSLPARASWLSGKFMQIVDSPRLDPTRFAVAFRNVKGEGVTFVDEVVVFDKDTKEVKYRILPYKPIPGSGRRSIVYSTGAGWKKPLFRGRWPDVKQWFRSYVDQQTLTHDEKATETQLSVVTRGPNDPAPDAKPDAPVAAKKRVKAKKSAKHVVRGKHREARATA